YFHENMSPWKYKFFYLIEKFCAKWCTDYIFTQSEEDGELAKNKRFLAPGNITVIGNGVDVEMKFNPDNILEKEKEKYRSEFGFSKDDVIVTFIGRLVEEKGIFDLLEAFQKIEKDNVKLLVIGDTYSSE